MGKKSVSLVAIENIKKPNYWLGFDISMVEFSQTELFYGLTGWLLFKILPFAVYAISLLFHFIILNISNPLHF